MLIHLIYSSTANQKFTESDLIDLLSKARAKNARLGITGMLLYTNDSFFQVLEGEAEQVDALADRISHDPRHTGLITIIREPIAKRAFGEWTMGYASVSQIDVGEIVGINDFFASATCFGQLNPGRAKKLLAAFKEGRWQKKVKSVAMPLKSTPASSELMRPAGIQPINVTYAYLPIIDSETLSVVSFEAKLRGLNNETLDDFLRAMPSIERSQFDGYCRGLAISMAARLGLKCALNLRMMAENATDARVAIRSTIEIAEKENIDPSRIILEIDENRLLNDAVVVASIIDEYRGAGLRILINDFGAGRGALDVLETYRPEMISLSESLVRGVESNFPRQAIVRGISQTCGDLGIDLVAKHVHTIEAYDWLRSEGVTLFQGDLFSPAGFEHFPNVTFPNSASSSS
ncbi:MAG: diguanylate phosphodiesterase [Schlesneria sp.]